MKECNHPTCGDTCRREKKPKKIYALKRTCLKKKQYYANRPHPDRQKKWYDDFRKTMTGVCCNCGGRSLKNDDKRWKYSAAHILPKRPSMFPSVATHPLNVLELCWQCHHDFDSSWDKASKMPCFVIAVEKFNEFKDGIAPHELYRIPECFIEKSSVETELRSNNPMKKENKS